MKTQNKNFTIGTTKENVESKKTNTKLNVIGIVYLLLMTALIAIGLSAFGVPKNQSFRVLYNATVANIQQKNFEAALPTALEMFEKQPDNNNVNYIVGLCYLNIKLNQTKAVPFLERAIQNTTADYEISNSREKAAPEIANLFLGNAYQYAYRYEDALNTYFSCLGILVKEHKGVKARKLYNDIIRCIHDCKKSLEDENEPVQVRELESMDGVTELDY